MTYSSEQVMQGLINYIDSEVMAKLPTSSKWIVGTAVGLASTRANEVVDMLHNNALAKMLGIIDENGMIEVDELMSALKTAANKYGKLEVSVPLVGRMSFSESDVDNLEAYIR